MTQYEARVPTPRVLVVDDDRAIATTLAMILNKNGFEAVAAFSGSQALSLAHESRFDLLLTDVMMAPINGVQTAIAFRNLNPASHIFLFSGTTDAADLLLGATNAGYDFKFFLKPIHPAKIISELRAVFAAEPRPCPEP